MDELVDAVTNMTINDVGYELNAATASDAQVGFARNPEKNTHTSNGITHQKLLSIRTIGIFQKYISIWLHLTDPRIGVNNKPPLLISTGVVQALHALQSLAVKEIVADVALKRTGTNMTTK